MFNSQYNLLLTFTDTYINKFLLNILNNYIKKIKLICVYTKIGYYDEDSTCVIIVG